jgi:hypothetical protein
MVNGAIEAVKQRYTSRTPQANRCKPARRPLGLVIDLLHDLEVPCAVPRSAIPIPTAPVTKTTRPARTGCALHALRHFCANGCPTGDKVVLEIHQDAEEGMYKRSPRKASSSRHTCSSMNLTNEQTLLRDVSAVLHGTRTESHDQPEWTSHRGPIATMRSRRHMQQEYPALCVKSVRRRCRSLFATPSHLKTFLRDVFEPIYQLSSPRQKHVSRSSFFLLFGCRHVPP